MRRGYDPTYGSREQLKDCREHGMKVARERDALKTEKDQMTGQIQEMQWRIEDLTEKLMVLEQCNDALITANEALMADIKLSSQLLDACVAFMS